MELVSLAKEAVQSVAEHAASYKLGQTALRHLDRTLWVIEKCARWAVPPPLDQDERPQPELVRPLPWVFFLTMLITLRITRESISLLNLVMGKPPLRSADVVTYIQGKRRDLRTLKYQGNRMMRARTSTSQPRESWSNSLHSLFEFTMCFRRHSSHYGNNNTTSISNNDEVLVVKRSKRDREQTSPGASTSETTMERLIEKMMVDLDTDSDEDSSFTLTNVTSPKSERSDFTVDSDQDVTFQNNLSAISNENKTNSNTTYDSTKTPVQRKDKISEAPSSTPEKSNEVPSSTPEKSNEVPSSTPEKSNEVPSSTPEKNDQVTKEPTSEEASKEESRSRDTSKIPRTPNNEQKIANGRTAKSVPSKKKGSTTVKDSRADKHNTKSAPGHTTM